MKLKTSIIAALAAATALAGCGSSSSGPPHATVVLDFTANAVHAGIYSAVARGYDKAHGVSLDVQQPSASTDSIKLLLANRADFAILDIHDLAIARAQGEPLVGVLPIDQEPLAAVIAQPSITSPAQLQGKHVRVTGAPSDTAVLDSIVAGGGGTPSKVQQITIGYNAVSSLLAGSVEAATAFWDVEGVALQRKRPGFHEFRVDQFGAPAYPELVLCATAATLRSRPAFVHDVVAAIEQGYQLTISDPAASAKDELKAVPGLDAWLLLAELEVLHGAFAAPGLPYGTFDFPRLKQWAAWEARFGIVKSAPDVASMFAGQ